MPYPPPNGFDAYAIGLASKYRKKGQRNHCDWPMTHGFPTAVASVLRAETCGKSQVQLNMLMATDAVCNRLAELTPGQDRIVVRLRECLREGNLAPDDMVYNEVTEANCCLNAWT